MKVSAVRFRATCKKVGDLSCLCNGQLSQFNLTLENAIFGGSALFLPMCERPRLCGLPLLGVTRSHLHHRHKYSVNSFSWWEQSRHVSQHTGHCFSPYQEANIAASPLLGQARARFCLAAGNKLGCTSVHQRHKSFLNCIPQR